MKNEQQIWFEFRKPTGSSPLYRWREDAAGAVLGGGGRGAAPGFHFGRRYLGHTMSGGGA